MRLTLFPYEDGNGDTKWVKRFNGPSKGGDQANTIAVDHKGNVYVTGWSTGSGTGTDYTTIKYDDDGDTKWVKRFNGNGPQFQTARPMMKQMPWSWMPRAMCT